VGVSFFFYISNPIPLSLPLFLAPFHFLILFTHLACLSF
jgi:hypothetical protein